MKNKNALFVFLILVLIIVTACNLPIPHSAADTPEASAPTLVPTAAVPSSPLSLAELYQARVNAGEWTEGQGLINLLGMYTGATKSDDVLGNYTVEDFEATGLLSIADQYLANQPNDPLHDEVQKQVNLLVAPVDQLERFSRRHTAASATHLASLNVSIPHDTGNEANCRRLWADGFTGTNPIVCFEYDEAEVDGTQIRLFYPSWWPSDDPRRARLEPIFAAASLAVRTYNAYGPNPLSPVTLVITELAGTDPVTHRRNADLIALAKQTRSAAPGCYVGIFPTLFGTNEAQSQQALAHEMFHCYQYRNLADQERGPVQSENEWWIEGSAEYFSNVVYPAVNYEHRWLGRLTTAMRESNLMSWSYKSFIFFQYLENRADVGTPGVINLLRAMPTSGGADEQRAALSGYANMNAIFHEFAQAVADQNVVDLDGSAIPLEVPLALDDVTEVTPGNIFSREPFSIDIHRVIFPLGFDYSLTGRVTGNPGQTSARLESSPRAWGPIPPDVVAGCGEMRYLVVETQTGANADNSYEILLRATSRASTGQCSCLTGRWLLDNSSYLTHLNGLIEQAAPGTVNYTGVEGSLIAQFSVDGNLTQDIEGLTISADMTVSGLPTQTMLITMDGTSSSSYLLVEGSLHYTSVESHLTLSTLLNGQPLNNTTPSDYLSSGPLGSGATYVCSENNLSLTPIYPGYTNLPALTFIRQSP